MQCAKRRFALVHRLLLAGMLSLGTVTPLHAQHTHGAAPQGDAAPAPFVASTAKPFHRLMDDAMAVMHYGMRTAPMNGDPDHDFVAMMIPHHQGAIDMAEALLLYTRDPELRNLAHAIITEQHNEIRLMQAWLSRHSSSETGDPPR